MRTATLFFIALVLFIGSEALLSYFGYVEIYFLFFIPVFVSSSPISFAPLLFFLIPVLHSLALNREGLPYEEFGFSGPEMERSEKKNETKFGGIVMVGPVPIIFGKGVSGKAMIVLAIIMLALVISWLVLAK